MNPPSGPLDSQPEFRRARAVVAATRHHDATRRTLLWQASVILGIAPLGLGGCASRRTENGGSRPVGPVVDSAPETGSLSATEIDDLVAFGEIVVEGRTLPPPARRYLVEYIEDRTRQSTGYRSLYRKTTRTLNRLAGRQFAALAAPERSELIARHRLAAWRVDPEEDLGPSPTEMLDLRTRLVPDLIRGYYASPAGWAVVGYDTYPGRCGDLTSYTRPEA